MTTGKWAHAGIPHKGWACSGVEDLGAPTQVCEMCEVQEIRYVHTMQHPEYPTALEVGCVCAGHMEGDLERAKGREREVKSRSRRRENWVSKPWRLSARGNEYINAFGHNAVVYRKGAAWAVRLHNEATGEDRFSSTPFPTATAAKAAVFDVLNPA